MNRTDVKIVRSDIPDTNFNYVMHANFSQRDLKQSVRRVIEEFKKTSFAWWVAENNRSMGLIDCLEKSH